MTPSQALARSLQVVIKVRARSQEKSIHETLLHYAFTLSPFVEATAPGICTVQFTTWHRRPAENSLVSPDQSVRPYSGRAGRQSLDKVVHVIGHFTQYEMLAKAV